ncbi:MAG TPA: hypothetical protein VFM60_03345 [Salinimicrobium sp.]|nr:hypothetical protein [Salinimicrobium sp.]
MAKKSLFTVKENIDFKESMKNSSLLFKIGTIAFSFAIAYLGNLLVAGLILLMMWFIKFLQDKKNHRTFSPKSSNNSYLLISKYCFKEYSRGNYLEEFINDLSGQKKRFRGTGRI